MKKIISCLFVIISLSAAAQERTATTGDQSSSQVRNAATSGKVEATPLPYDVNDKYMGRKDEFLNMLTVKELPADFPLYDKQWGLKEYNAVVDAWAQDHMDILKERVRQKVQYHKDQQGK
jgi:hypothetical protein